MARDFIIGAETLVEVGLFIYSGGEYGHTFNNQPDIDLGLASKYAELGLSVGPIKISPRFVHRDIKVDDYGSEIPAEVMNMMSEVYIHMTLVHYDPEILSSCINESTGGSIVEGTLTPTGSTMGGGVPLTTSGNHYIDLRLTPGVLSLVNPYRFPSAYLVSQPLEIPLGVETTLVQTTWRAIPQPNIFRGLATPGSTIPFEIISSGTVLWYRS